MVVVADTEEAVVEVAATADANINLGIAGEIKGRRDRNVPSAFFVEPRDFPY